MRSPYGLEIAECCTDCRLRSAGFFCNFSPATLQHFDHIKFASTFPGSAVLFLEGQPARGIFVICQGLVKQSTCSRDGKTLIMKLAKAGEVLGLSATVLGKRYEATAETIEPCQVVHVKRDDLLHFLHQYGDACLGAAEQLSRNYNAVCREIRSLALSHSAAGRLARYLLVLIADSGETENQQPRVRMPFTHEEIAQMIGTTRETVTRLLAFFRRRNIVRTEGTLLVIQNRAALQALVEAPRSKRHPFTPAHVPECTTRRQEIARAR